MLTQNQKAALERLIQHGKRDSGQAAKVANFLLCWWNADEQGKFDIRELWAVDDEIAADILMVLSFVANNNGVYPDQLGYEADFQHIIKAHR